jgi:PHD/YefM family antitoxin component YafN of YafNO toxin-antitoxin module
MKSESTVNVTEAQANLPRLLKRDSFAISRHGKVVGFYLSKDRIEAMIETMELIGDESFMAALREYKSGKMKFYDVDKLDKEMSA